MSNRPTHTAHIVIPASNEGDKPRWIEVGALWPHQKGNGFDLVIPPGMSISGRIVILERKTTETGS